MGLSIFDLASPSYAGYLRQYQYGEKQKPSLIERRHMPASLQIMEDKKPYLDPQFNLCQLANLACTNRTRLSSTLNNQTGMNFQSLAGYLSGREITSYGNFQVPHTRAAGVIQDGWVYLPYLFLPPIQGGDGQHSHRVLRQPIL